MTAAAAGNQHIHGSLQSTQLARKNGIPQSASKTNSQANLNGHIVNQRTKHASNTRPGTNVNVRDVSITSGHSNSSFNNQITGVSMTNYQKVRTTQPQSVKHANEPYSQGAPAAKVNDFSSALRSSDATDDLVKNYNQF